MSEDRMTVAGAYARIEGHEELCAERYRVINQTIGEIKSGVRWVLGGLASLVVGLIGWMAVQLYALEPLRVDAQARPAAALPEDAPAAIAIANPTP